jgi:hypothetical protein
MMASLEDSTIADSRAIVVSAAFRSLMSVLTDEVALLVEHGRDEHEHRQPGTVLAVYPELVDHRGALAEAVDQRRQAGVVELEGDGFDEVAAEHLLGEEAEKLLRPFAPVRDPKADVGGDDGLSDGFEQARLELDPPSGRPDAHCGHPEEFVTAACAISA